MCMRRSNSILNHIITITRTRTSFTIRIHTTLVVIILITAIIITTLAITTTLAIITTVVVLEVEDPKVVAGAEDVEDLDRMEDPLWGEFELRVSTKQGSTAGSEMTLTAL